MKSNTWIFQASPDRFDVDAFVDKAPTTARWKVTTGAKSMRPGDVAYVWRAVGGENPDGARAGVIGRAEVTGPADERADDSPTKAFWRSRGDADLVTSRVPIRITDLTPEPRIPRSELLKDPVLRDRQIIRAPQASNFRLGDDEAARLSALWDAAGTDWSEPEILAALVAYRRPGKLDERVDWLSSMLPRYFLDARRRISRFSTVDPAAPYHVAGGKGPEAEVWEHYLGAKGKGEAAIVRDFRKAWPKAAKAMSDAQVA